ncbi:ABC transporter substrate-binding protein [Streptomyces sp. NPDC087901]|uniref:ABC transporter substrate-binding protein n=1 Tax=Streptomyces sp. NPDC087901 TaxID=3365818 RepID=UPI003805FBE7
MPTPRRRRSALPLTLSATALLVPLATACSGSASDGAADGGQRLRVVMAFPPAQAMSPYGDDAVTLSRLAVIEGLTGLGSDGTAKPALAASWKRDSAKEWTFTLRKASFQDGTKLDPAAVVRSLTAAEKASPKPRVLSDTGITATAQGADTVRIVTDEADPLLPQRLANPSLTILSAAAYTDGKVSPAGHATGPFTLAAVKGAVSATLERNDTYWGAKAKAPGVDVTFVADGTARANALRTEAVDVAEYVPISQASLLGDGLVHEFPSARTNGLSLNTGSGVFADPAMRAAAREAVDSQALVKAVYEGRADTAQGLLGPGVPWATAARTAAPVDRAKAADKAQVAKTEEIVLATYTNRPELPEVATVVQQQLTARGFTVKQVVRDYAQLEADALAGKYDAFIQARNTLLDTADPVSYFASDFTCDGSFNISQLCDKRVDADVNKAAGTAGTDARHAAAAAAEADVLGTDALVPLLHERFVQGYDDSRVQGVSLDPMERTLITADTRVG